ncbi:hypothetical protein OIE43_39805 [Streptomyces pseudovenezuelae]|uniref:hypothetical protein n=1 Tax=Streptomyces pseudovenezuelae TaxID=67350 RepID=UPI002E33D897|nr:hypothetical protein [Streptomyces pseudovenezuelae]
MSAGGDRWPGPRREARFAPVVALLAHERLTAEQVRYLPEVLEATVAALVAHARLSLTAAFAR